MPWGCLRFFKDVLMFLGRDLGGFPKGTLTWFVCGVMFFGTPEAQKEATVVWGPLFRDSKMLLCSPFGFHINPAK